MLLALPAWASAALLAHMDKSEITLGEPVTVTLSTEHARESLDELKLNTLQADFDIYHRSSDTQTQTIHGRQVTSQTMTLVLYPLHSGRILFPALRFAGASSRPLVLEVRPSGADVPRVWFKLTLHPERLVTRQTARLVLDIYDDGSLQWSPLWLPPPAAVHVRELVSSQHEEILDGTPVTVHRRAWAIMPLRAGSSVVNLPMLEALKFGKRLRYALPSLQFDTRPAPAYLPVYVPIGKIEVRSRTPTGTLVLDRPVNWILTVRGTGLSAEGLAKLLPVLADNDALRFYPAQIEQIGDANTLAQTWRLTLPFQPLRAGNMRLPTLVLPYYDPLGGRIESVVVQPPAITAVNPLWHRLARLAVIAGLLVAVTWLAYVCWRQYQRWQVRRASLRRIEAATDCSELSQALRDFDPGAGDLRAATLNQWLAAMALHHGENTTLRQLVQQLQACCYGVSSAGGGNYQDLRQSAIDVLRTVRCNKKRSARLRFRKCSS
ncbi:BatD family protein [Sulfuriferula sp. GW1]|uniref:BatD family protein n=1 Tax=Sulfuriferula sp. GW1 TaxID=3345111 RepID=UPI0039B05D37